MIIANGIAANKSAKHLLRRLKRSRRTRETNLAISIFCYRTPPPFEWSFFFICQAKHPEITSTIHKTFFKIIYWRNGQEFLISHRLPLNFASVSLIYTSLWFSPLLVSGNPAFSRTSFQYAILAHCFQSSPAFVSLVMQTKSGLMFMSKVWRVFELKKRYIIF